MNITITPKTHKITMSNSPLGLGNVDNTSDLLKPISTATQTALDLKVDNSQFNKITIDAMGINATTLDGLDSTSLSLATHNHDLNYEPMNPNIQSHISFFGNPHATTPLDIGLGNVDNTSDLLKPISTATQTALDNIVSESFYTIWAEENAGLSNNTWRWAYGNGAVTGPGGGVTIMVPTGYNCEAVSMSLTTGIVSTTRVSLVVNGIVQNTAAEVNTITSQYGTEIFPNPIALVNGDLINFKTLTTDGSGSPNVVSVLIRIWK